jgi:thioredoxin 1
LNRWWLGLILILSACSLFFGCWGTATSLWAEEIKTQKVLTVTDANFEPDVLKSEKPIVVDFWAGWCANCRPLSLLMDKMADRYLGKLKIARVNVEENPRFPRRFGVETLPTVLVFNRGKVVKRWIGLVPEDRLKDGIEKVLKSK